MLSAPFTIDASVAATAVDLTDIVSGDTLDVTLRVYGFLASDTVTSIVLTAKVAASDSDVAPTSVQKTITPDGTGVAPSGIRTVALSPTAYDAHFLLSTSDTARLVGCTVYTLRVFATRNGQQLDRTVLRGNLTVTAGSIIFSGAASFTTGARAFAAAGGTDELTYLRTNLVGGDSAIAAWYSAAYGITVDGSNNVTSWADARGGGFGPSLPPRDTSGPALSAGTTATRTLNTANVQALRGTANALFDVSTPKSVVYVGTMGGGAAGCPVGIYDDSSRLLAVDEDTSTNHGYPYADWFSPGPSLVRSSLGASPSVRALSNKKRLMVAAQDGSTLAINCPPLVEVTSAITAQSAGNLKGMVGNVTSAYVVESVRAFLVLTRRATSADMIVLRQWAAVFHGAVNGPTNAIYAIDGDSRPAGFGLNTLDQAYPNVAFNTAATPMLLADDANLAIQGSKIADVQARAASMDALYSGSRSKNVCIVDILTNNIAHDAPYVQATSLAALWAYTDARRAVGWKVVVCTCIPLGWNGSDTPANQAALDALIASTNSALVAQWASHADALCDFTLDFPFNSPSAYSNSTYYQADLAHPKQAGAVILGARLATVLAAL